MATLANRDWWTIDAHGQPLRVRCLSHNVVIGTARVVADDGVFAEIDARELHHSPEAVRQYAKTAADGVWTTLPQ